ncbi:MAG: hypothetical protein J6B16_04375 [Clostridia bacterium]|nr:hypothetical protein [Clostridia bacterium]
MSFVRNADKIPAHLPKRLTISFPIWGLYDTDESGAYHDIDKMMREHVERGFNCIRLDDGAGLIHDCDGKLRGKVVFGQIFGEHDRTMRQFGATGEPGLCDIHGRLIAFFEAAKRHGIYVILSSWYYLHTCWFLKDRKLNKELHDIPPLERFQAFAEYLHYILVELEDRGLDTQIAFAEIFNEADGLRFVNGYGENNLSDAEIAVFREKHEAAIAWLKERHPHILFAFDSWSYYPDVRQAPTNLEVLNFHNYFLWRVYDYLEADESLLGSTRISKEEIEALADSDNIPDYGWYNRVYFYANLDSEKIPFVEEKMISYLKKHIEDFKGKVNRSVADLKGILEKHFPNVPVVCGEGVTYSGGYKLLWEEKSEEYWELVKEMVILYREAGLWGTVIRTCSGPEDPSWNLCPQKLLEMNKIFLGND